MSKSTPTLTRSLREQIEWYFRNNRADQSLFESDVQDIIYSGITAPMSYIKGSSGTSPTESKAMRLMEMTDNRKDWSAVVRNTYVNYYGRIEHDIMISLYSNGLSRSDIIEHFRICKKRFYRYRDRWLKEALKWAMEFELFPLLEMLE